MVTRMTTTMKMMMTMTAMMTSAMMTTMMLMMVMTLTVRFSFCSRWFRRGRLFSAAAFPPTRAHAGVLRVRPSGPKCPVRVRSFP